MPDTIQVSTRASRGLAHNRHEGDNPGRSSTARTVCHDESFGPLKKCTVEPERTECRMLYMMLGAKLQTRDV